MTGGARAGRTLALALATTASSLLLLPASVSGQTCPSITVPGGECSTTTTAPVVTTGSTTTTTAPATTTTARAAATTTTARQATTTAAQQTTTTVLPPASNILVPGDGTEGAESTTTTLATATKVNDGGPSDGTLISLVIAGLVLIAVVVAVLTWRYWVATRPPIVGTEPPTKGKPTPARTG